MISSEATATNGMQTNGVHHSHVNGNSHSSVNGNGNGNGIGSHLHAEYPLSVIVVGAGIAGLALACNLGNAGHKVVVLEAAPAIAEVGAGINCSPNLTRLLSRWGLDSRVRKHTNALARIDLRRWQDGEFLGAATLMPEIEKRHGAPQYAIHRADIHCALMEEAETVAAVRIDSMVTAVDFDKPSVTLSDGSVLEADVVVGADGLWPLSGWGTPTYTLIRHEVDVQKTHLPEAWTRRQGETHGRRGVSSVHPAGHCHGPRVESLPERAGGHEMDGA